MSDEFTLSVPADARFRVLAAELAGRFAKLIGGTDADAAALSTSVADAVDQTADAAGPAADLTVLCRGEAAGIEVELRATGAGEAVQVRHPLHARKA